MPPRTGYRDESAPEDLDDLEARDRLYERYGQQGFAMPDHVPRVLESRRGSERIELGERAVPQGPKNWQRSDERIRDDVCTLLADDPWVDARNLEVVVHQREVSLIGTVSDFRQRARAVAIAESVRGVVDVLSRVRIDRAEADDVPSRR
jgi:hypothetical protein